MIKLFSADDVSRPRGSAKRMPPVIDIYCIAVSVSVLAGYDTQRLCPEPPWDVPNVKQMRNAEPRRNIYPGAIVEKLS